MKLQVIIGSTREGRISDRVGKWVVQTAKNLDYDVELIDLRDYELPFLNEAISPQGNPDRKPTPAVKKWLDKISEADAYILVTPEYNRSYSAVLKNALDHIAFEFKEKAVGLVAHGSAGGAQAVAHLRGVIPGIQAITVPNATFFSDSAAAKIDDDGNLDEAVKNRPHGPQFALDGTLAQVKWYSDALAAAR